MRVIKKKKKRERIFVFSLVFYYYLNIGSECTFFLRVLSVPQVGVAGHETTAS